MTHRETSDLRKSSTSNVSCGIALFALLAGCQAATAATSCVSPGAACAYQTIGAAVTGSNPGDTIQVMPGVYNESVTITKSLILLGSGSGTIINAIGLSNGIFINGMASAPALGVSGVVISGITVENANFEGILIANATNVTITGNQVVGNNRSLNIANAACPGAPAYETNEGFDCGEGIHLMAVDHSAITNNMVKNNAGGILLSDETGPTFLNVISGNTVLNNLYDCGVTLASHTPAISSLASPPGVYQNTISGNMISGNGTLVPGAGAGVGIFAPGPGNKNYANVVINNVLANNGLPGVAMHNHAWFPQAPPVNMNDNMIIGNQIYGNGADTDDAATPGTAGINIFSLAPVTGTVITGNAIHNQQFAIVVNTPSGGAQAHLNDLSAPTGVGNIGAGTVDATGNYWGCAGGPGNSGCGGSTGSVTTSAPASSPF